MAEEKEKKDSYTRLFNPILEALIKKDFSGREYKIIFFVIRSTYGWNKKKFAMSKSYIAEGTGIDRRKVGTIIKDLVDRHILIDYGTDKKSRCKIYGLNKKFSQWDNPMCAENDTDDNGDICAPKSNIDIVDNGDDMSAENGAENKHIKRHIKKEKEKKCSQKRPFLNEDGMWEMPDEGDDVDGDV